MSKKQKHYRSKTIKLDHFNAGKSKVRFVGGVRPHFWFGSEFSFLGCMDNARDVRRLRQCCDEYLEAKEK